MNTINGTYGSNQTPCNVFFNEDSGWYCVEGSLNVNQCDPALLVDGVDVEELEDYDCFTWSSEIETEEELEQAIEA